MFAWESPYFSKGRDLLTTIIKSTVIDIFMFLIKRKILNFEGYLIHLITFFQDYDEVRRILTIAIQRWGYMKF
jgi:hypothetical protein